MHPPPQPALPTPRAAGTRGGPWSFSYTPGTYTYTVITEGTIAPLSDTTLKYSSPALPQHATITLSADGNIQVVSPAAGVGGACDISAAALTRAQQLIPALPAHMTAGESWSDSTTTDGCRGSVPATSHIARTYMVLGDTMLLGVNALHVHRDEVISATGEGAQGQHRVLISATGNGSTELYFDTTTGRFLGSNGIQNSIVDVNASGRTARFVQRVIHRAGLTNTP